MQHVAAVAIAATLVAVAAGCSPASVKPAAKVRDGELAVPADYRSWPKFLVDVQRPDAKQIRDIYINPIGSGIGPGETFPNGTVSVMDLYKARENPDGSLMKTPDGKLVKGDLLKVFVMGKGAGWGDTVAKPELKNGDWVYGAYKAAVNHFTRSLAVQVGHRGVRVNAIAPDVTDSLQVPYDRMVPEDQRHLWPRWVPVGRMGVPEDQARIVLFLASDQSAFLTGQVLNTAGGTEVAGGWFRTDRGRGGWTNRPVDP